MSSYGSTRMAGLFSTILLPPENYMFPPKNLCGKNIHKLCLHMWISYLSVLSIKTKKGKKKSEIKGLMCPVWQQGTMVRRDNIKMQQIFFGCSRYILRVESVFHQPCLSAGRQLSTCQIPSNPWSLTAHLPKQIQVVLWASNLFNHEKRPLSSPNLPFTLRFQACFNVVSGESW